ncbi:hypothetical protein [Cupriavidus basilensis]|nr:hypothetical protein [Cupriavidus basilensis]
MSRQLAVMVALLAASGLSQAVTKCLSGGEVLYTSASCPAGYMNVTGTMRGHLFTVPNVAKTLRADQAYSRIRTQTAELVRAQRERDKEWNLRSQNLSLNQCLILDYRVRATERAMNETEYWSRADRYREHVDALRAEQYYQGCFG